MSGALLYLGVLMVTFLLGIPVALGLGGTPSFSRFLNVAWKASVPLFLPSGQPTV